MPRVWLHLLLFGITCVTTTITGVWWAGQEKELASFFEPLTTALAATASGDLHFLVNGLLFSVALLTILAAHEFGHYFACRYYGIRATLPFFIPAPPMITFFGTFGAVIKIKSPFTSRRALFDVGIAGPLAGFAVALPVSIIGLWLAQPSAPPKAGATIFQDPPLFQLLAHVVNAPTIWDWNPFYWAAWGALLVTALNLFPVGQLDGGHVLYAVTGGRVHRFVSWGVSVAVAALAIFSIVWRGSPIWLLWTAVLFFMTKVGHPPIMDEEPLGAGRVILAVVALVVFLLCFMPFPIATYAKP